MLYNIFAALLFSITLDPYTCKMHSSIYFWKLINPNADQYFSNCFKKSFFEIFYILVFNGYLAFIKKVAKLKETTVFFLTSYIVYAPNVPALIIIIIVNLSLGHQVQLQPSPSILALLQVLYHYPTPSILFTPGSPTYTL